MANRTVLGILIGEWNVVSKRKIQDFILQFNSKIYTMCYNVIKLAVVILTAGTFLLATIRYVVIVCFH